MIDINGTYIFGRNTRKNGPDLVWTNGTERYGIHSSSKSFEFIEIKPDGTATVASGEYSGSYYKNCQYRQIKK